MVICSRLTVRSESRTLDFQGIFHPHSLPLPISCHSYTICFISWFFSWRFMVLPTGQLVFVYWLIAFKEIIIFDHSLILHCSLILHILNHSVNTVSNSKDWAEIEGNRMPRLVAISCKQRWDGETGSSWDLLKISQKHILPLLPNDWEDTQLSLPLERLIKGAVSRRKTIFYCCLQRSCLL